MGRAIVRHPQVFLMDEPLSNLDAKLRVQMRADIAKLQQELATTTIYVTHDQIEAMTMGDRVAVMQSGVLQQVAEPQMLYDRPENLFVAGFIGTPPMNLLEAKVSVNGGVSVELGGKTLDVPDQALKAYPKVRSYNGRTVIAGLRSQFIHPASERPELPTIDGARRPRRGARRRVDRLLPDRRACDPRRRGRAGGRGGCGRGRPGRLTPESRRAVPGARRPEAPVAGLGRRRRRPAPLLRRGLG